MKPFEVREIKKVLNGNFLLAMNERQKVKLVNCLLEIVEDMENGNINQRSRKVKKIKVK